MLRVSSAAFALSATPLSLAASTPSTSDLIPGRQAVPDYAPVEAVLFSADLLSANYHAAALVQAIADAHADIWILTNAKSGHRELARNLKQQGVSAQALARVKFLVVPHDNIWVRDFGPFPVFAGNTLRLIDFLYDDTGKTNDAVPGRLGQLLGLGVEAVPIALDGGNFQTNGEFCFTTSSDLPISKDHAPGKEATLAAQLTGQRGRIGCQQVIVINDPPHAHLDMWARVVDQQTVLVSELEPRTMELMQATYGHIPEDVAALRAALDRKAGELKQHLKVQRLPLPLPYRGTFRTYANTLLVNGHAIIPSYQRFGWNYDDYPDAVLKTYYETKVQDTYRALGFEPHLINADGLIYNGGAFRCVTAQIPRRRSGGSPTWKGP